MERERERKKHMESEEGMGEGRKKNLIGNYTITDPKKIESK